MKADKRTDDAARSETSGEQRRQRARTPVGSNQTHARTATQEGKE